MFTPFNAPLQPIAIDSGTTLTRLAKLEAVHRRWTSEHIVRALVLAGLVFVLAFGAVALTRADGFVAPLWLANAVIVGIVIRAPRSQWFALLAIAFLANLGANLTNDAPLPRAAMLSAINIVESLIVLLLIGRQVEQSSWSDDSTDIGRFLISAGVIGPLASATLAAAALALTEGAAFVATLTGWYIANALGLLTLGALMLAAPLDRAPAPRGKWLGGAVCVLLSCLVSLFVFSQDNAPLLFIVAPALMIATLRAPLIAAMSAFAACVGIAIGAALLGHGPIALAALDPTTRLHVLVGFVASMVFVVLPVRALVGERDRLGEVIARSERLFARMSDASPSGTIHFDAQGRPTFANHRWTYLTGLDLTALAGDRWLEAIAPADRSAASSLWARARATLEPCSGEFRVARDGEPAGHAELSLYPEVEDGKVLGFAARLTDVTARRMAEAALQEREARYRLVTENAHDVILRLGLDGRPLYASGASLRVTGYAPVEMLGRPLADLIHGDDLPSVKRALARITEGVTDPSIEFRLRHRDGHFSWFESSQRVMYDGDGNPVEIVASLRNIERRRRAEATASAAEAALVEARDAAQAAAVAKNHFLATMSHDIRTPMTGVLGLIDLLRDDPAPAERDHFFATLRQSADALMAVLDDALGFSTIDSGDVQLASSDFDLEAVAMATLDLFDHAASRKGLLVAFESACETPPQVRGDAVRLKQILSSLLSNAIRSTEQGEIRLALSGTAIGEGRSRYEFKLKASGVGLDPDQIDALFDPFVQPGANGSRHFDGAGLGLAISRRLVRSMGGDISVRSRPGEGSVFSFDVTLADGPRVEGSGQQAAIVMPRADALDILVAEDNPVNQMLIAALVRRMGHAVTIVENGRRAVAAAAANHYDVILMDMQMPVMDGLAATRAIRASAGPCAETAIIALTADASPERRRFYDGAGLSHFLTKPIDRQALAASLAAIGPSRRRRATPGLVAERPPALVEFERIEELRSALGNVRLEALLGLLIAECLDRPARLRTALCRGEVVAIRAEGHGLKGAALSIGATALGQAAEQLAEVASVALAEPLITALEECAQATRSAVLRLLDSPTDDRASA